MGWKIQSFDLKRNV